MIPRLLIAAISITLMGCSAKMQVHFTRQDIAKVSINPKRCAQMANGDLLCRDVVVRLNRIRAK